MKSMIRLSLFLVILLSAVLLWFAPQSIEFRLSAITFLITALLLIESFLQQPDRGHSWHREAIQSQPRHKFRAVPSRKVA